MKTEQQIIENFIDELVKNKIQITAIRDTSAMLAIMVSKATSTDLMMVTKDIEEVAHNIQDAFNNNIEHKYLSKEEKSRGEI